MEQRTRQSHFVKEWGGEKFALIRGFNFFTLKFVSTSRAWHSNGTASLAAHHTLQGGKGSLKKKRRKFGKRKMFQTEAVKRRAAGKRGHYMWDVATVREATPVTSTAFPAHSSRLEVWFFFFFASLKHTHINCLLVHGVAHKPFSMYDTRLPSLHFEWSFCSHAPAASGINPYSSFRGLWSPHAAVMAARKVALAKT